jgi:AbrB family looped-hinge helix DNA binding protein
MNETTMSTKGQVVIPQEIRTRLDLKPGTKFSVSHNFGGITLVPIDPFRPCAVGDAFLCLKYNPNKFDDYARLTKRLERSGKRMKNGMR